MYRQVVLELDAGALSDSDLAHLPNKVEEMMNRVYFREESNHSVSEHMLSFPLLRTEG